MHQHGINNAYGAHVQASCYLNKLPPSFDQTDHILVADCMLATGGTLLQARLGI